MPPSHHEEAFELAVVAGLTARGWVEGCASEVDPDTGFRIGDTIAWLRATQPDAVKALATRFGAELEPRIASWLRATVRGAGTLKLLRDGTDIDDVHLDLLGKKPAHGLNPEVGRRYASNVLTVTRQVRPSPSTGEELDLALHVNGLPVATVELKNPMTGQSVEDAMAQYRGRDPETSPILQFKRGALVHFAVDTEEAAMTTQLRGGETEFLPFNRGRDLGAGNPAMEGRHATSYLWEDVWARDSMIDLVTRFVHLLRVKKRKGRRQEYVERMLFPRFHQRDAVRLLEADARARGAGRNYLIQHSPGSGKSNTIAWLAYGLSSLHDEGDRKVFDQVIVLTDRRVLDQQLQETLRQFQRDKGYVAYVEDSVELSEAMRGATPVVVSTMWKFPFVAEQVAAMPARRYALLIDEAHNSQTGSTAEATRQSLSGLSTPPREAPGEGAANATEPGDPEAPMDRVERVMRARGNRPNQSVFAFTATPRNTTLELFGHRDANGKPAPFHLYSMKQAIEERFILDVLLHYTSYDTAFRLSKKVREDPTVDARKAGAALARFLSEHPTTIAEKTQEMIEHFRARSMQRIGGRAKAMVVTATRLQAARYKKAFDAYIVGRPSYEGLRALVAFTETVTDPDTGEVYSEARLNPDGVADDALAARFDEDDSLRFLIVASKFQTGFDQPLLHTMYVDRPLKDVQAVQTLSRLNRACPGKEEDDTCVLDFVNDPDEVRQAFAQYHVETRVQTAVDPARIRTLFGEVLGHGVAVLSDAETFAKARFDATLSAPQAHAAMSAAITPALQRFKATDEDLRERFRASLGSYVDLYGLVSQIVELDDVSLEVLYQYGRMLCQALPKPKSEALPDLSRLVTLEWYSLRANAEASLGVRDGAAVPGYSPSGTASKPGPQEALSRILERMNQQFAASLGDADRTVCDAVLAECRAHAEMREWAEANDLDGFLVRLEGFVRKAFTRRYSPKGPAVVARYLQSEAFRKELLRELGRLLYDELGVRPAA